jgi:hypothetical protein
MMSTSVVHVARRFILFAFVAILVGAMFSVVEKSSPAGAASLGSTLSAGQMMGEGQMLSSQNGLYNAVLQTDGNFVLYGPKGALWWDGMNNGYGTNTLVMQSDGNLVDYLWNGYPLWNSRTMGSGGVNLVMQNDGNLVIYTASGRPVWSTGTAQPASSSPAPTPSPTPSPSPAPTPAPTPSPGCIGSGHSSMGSGQMLCAGQALSNGPYNAMMQSDGNFVVYYNGVPLWWTGTQGTGANTLVMQSDGNLVLYAPSGAKWWTGTQGTGANTLVMQSDGNLVLYAPSGAKWWTGTNTVVPPTVGVYAYPSGSAAIADGWNNVGVTAALGTPTNSWTGMAQGNDRPVGLAIQQSGRNLPWLSFWTVSAPTVWLNAGQSVGAGWAMSIGSFSVTFQSDGNLVVYGPSGATWSSGTSGSGATSMSVQTDGNIVLYGPRGAVWSTRTSGTGSGNQLVLQGNGALVVYTSGGSQVWSSNSGTNLTANPGDFYHTGYVAGQYAARQIDGYGLAIKPTFEILDPEGYPDAHSGLDTGNASDWQQMMQGWQDGLRSVDGAMNPAFYATQSEYRQFNLASINQPFFVAVAFGSDGGSGIVPPVRLSGVNGSNIVGVSAFYSGVTKAVQCATVSQAANAIANWGYRYNTLQFDGGLRCRA